MDMLNSVIDLLLHLAEHLDEASRIMVSGRMRTCFWLYSWKRGWS